MRCLPPADGMTLASFDEPAMAIYTPPLRLRAAPKWGCVTISVSFSACLAVCLSSYVCTWVTVRNTLYCMARTLASELSCMYALSVEQGSFPSVGVVENQIRRLDRLHQLLLPTSRGLTIRISELPCDRFLQSHPILYSPPRCCHGRRILQCPDSTHNIIRAANWLVLRRPAAITSRRACVFRLQLQICLYFLCDGS